MSEKSDSSSARSMIPCAPLGPWAPAFTRAWALGWPLVPLSPLDARELSLGSDSEWARMSPRPAAALPASASFFSGLRMASPCTAEVQKLRMEQRLPQFCSHWAWTLLVIAFFTSSPQVSRIFTRSTYGLGGKGNSERQVKKKNNIRVIYQSARVPTSLPYCPLAYRTVQQRLSPTTCLLGHQGVRNLLPWGPVLLPKLTLRCVIL